MRSAVYLNDPKEKLVMRIPTAWWLVAAVSLVIAGCGGGGGGTTCTTNCVSSTLSVATVSPANGATGVAVTAVPMVTILAVGKYIDSHFFDIHADAAGRGSRSGDGCLTRAHCDSSRQPLRWPITPPTRRLSQRACRALWEPRWLRTTPGPSLLALFPHRLFPR